jgi:hypothetical protein
MLSYTTLRNTFGTLSNNNSAANLTLFDQFMNTEHRYLLQKYFQNEESYSIETIGSFTLSITASPAIGATSATLSSAWTYPTSQTFVTFSDGEQRLATFTLNSTSVTWQNPLVGTQFALTTTVSSGATTATLASPWAYSSGARTTQFSDGEQKSVTYTQNSTAISWTGGLSGTVSAYVNTSVNTTSVGVGGIQTYNLPPDYWKLKTGTLTIGALRWNPTEVISRAAWDNLNVFPYYADIPSNIFIWQGKFNIWPIPSTTGNIITFNYKRRVPDLNLADYTTGTVSVTNGSTVITGSGTAFIPTMNSVGESRWIQISPNKGDNLWYQVQSVDSTTQITLVAPYQGITVSGGSYTLGQMPLLVEDFHDMLLYKPLYIYYSSVNKDKDKADQFENLYNERLASMAAATGTKTVNVNLRQYIRQQNPNLFPQNIG